MRTVLPVLINTGPRCDNNICSRYCWGGFEAAHSLGTRACKINGGRLEQLILSTEPCRQGDGPGILQPAETLLFSFLSLLYSACKTGPWPSNTPCSPSLSHLANQLHICALATRSLAEKKRREIESMAERSRWDLFFLSHLIYLSEADLKAQAEKREAGPGPWTRLPSNQTLYIWAE